MMENTEMQPNMPQNIFDEYFMSMQIPKGQNQDSYVRRDPYDHEENV